MAIDHSRLSLENQFLKNKSGRMFCVRQVYFTKSCQQFFYMFYTSYLRWNSTMRCCIYHTNLGKNAKSHNYSRQIALIQYSGRSIVGFFRDRSKKFLKSPSIRPAGCHFWQAPNLQKCERWSGVWMKINRVTLQHNKEFIMFIFYSVVL